MKKYIVSESFACLQFKQSPGNNNNKKNQNLTKLSLQKQNI